MIFFNLASLYKPIQTLILNPECTDVVLATTILSTSIIAWVNASSAVNALTGAGIALVRKTNALAAIMDTILRRTRAHALPAHPSTLTATNAQHKTVMSAGLVTQSS